MKKSLLMLMIFLLPIISFSQKSLEFTPVIGITGVDLDKLIEKDEIAGTVANDWGLMNYGISGQFFFATKGIFGFGGELMYDFLYWYEVEVPYGSQQIYREYDISTFKITPILRIGTDKKLAVDIGPEFNFMDGLNMGLLLSSNYYISISDKIDIPIKLRLDIINAIVITYPITLNVGIRLKL